MIEDKQAGICCKECGYEVVVTTKESMVRLSQDLLWVDGDPICPECGNCVWFEDYLEE